MSQKGFTLLELICVLAIVGLMASFGVVKFIKLDDTAAQTVARDAVVKFNDTEIHHWSNAKLADQYVDDDQLFELVKADLIKVHKWQSVSSEGGMISIREHSFQLIRKPSTVSRYGTWEVSKNG